MELLTEKFIYALKHSNSSLRNAAKEFMADFSGSPVDTYSDEVLFPIVKNFFIDYARTGDVYALLYHYFDYKKMRWNVIDIYGVMDNETPPRTYRNNNLISIRLDLDAMLTALDMVKVRKNGKLINGFTKEG